MTDMVNRPPHYATTRIECIDAISAMVEQWPGEPAYFAGNVVKYVWRHRGKAPVESLRKARWYLDRLIALAELPDKPIGSVSHGTTRTPSSAHSHTLSVAPPRADHEDTR